MTVSDKDNDKLVNNTIHLLDFLSELIINQEHEPNHNTNSSNSNTNSLAAKSADAAVTFDRTMNQLDEIISALDEAKNEEDNASKTPTGSTLTKKNKSPRLDNEEKMQIMAQYEALVELKQALDQQFQEYSLEPLKTDEDLHRERETDEQDHKDRGQYQYIDEEGATRGQSRGPDSTMSHPQNPHNDETLRGEDPIDIEPMEAMGRYEAYDDNGQKSSSIVLDDIERLKIPLVGVPGASPADLPLNEDTINVIVSNTNQNGNEGDPGSPGVAIYPVSEVEKLKSNISTLTGVDLDELVRRVSSSIGEVTLPIRVHEQHTQLSDQGGQDIPQYKYTETVANVMPGSNPRDPHVNIVSKRYEDGNYLGGMDYGRPPIPVPMNQVYSDGSDLPADISPIRNLGPSLQEIAESAAHGENVKVNVSTKTNIVNVFTFNIFVNNGTSNNNSDGNNFTLVKGAPLRSSIQTTANIDTMENGAAMPTSSFSLYQYNANTMESSNANPIPTRLNGGTGYKKEDWPMITPLSSPSSSPPRSPASAELEKWLKILLNHQAYGDGSNIVAEAVLKDASLTQIPEPRGTLYRSDDAGQSDNNQVIFQNLLAQQQAALLQQQQQQQQTQAPAIGPLGFRTNEAGEVVDNSNSPKKSSSSEDKGLFHAIASSPIPTVLAGVAALTPYLTSVLGKKKKRRRRRRDAEAVAKPILANRAVDIPEQWLGYLLGTRYANQVKKQVTKKPLKTTKATTFMTPVTKRSAEDEGQELFTTTSLFSSDDGDFVTSSLFSSQPWFDTTKAADPLTSTKTTVFTPVKRLNEGGTSSSKSSVSISRIRTKTKDEDIEKDTTENIAPESKSDGPTFNLLQHWASLYNSVKTNTPNKAKVPSRPTPVFRPVTTTATPTTTTTRTTTTTQRPRPTTTFKASTAASTSTLTPDWKKAIDKNKWTRIPGDFGSKINRYGINSFYYGPPDTTTELPDDKPIIEEAVRVSVSTATEVNLVPKETSQSPPPTEAPPVPKKNNIKSTNVPPSLWLTAKDILTNLGQKFLYNHNNQNNNVKEQNDDMTNSPIVIIPVNENEPKPEVNVAALKPLVSKKPITFINMNSLKQRTPPPATETTTTTTTSRPRMPKPPSKSFVEAFLARYNKTVAAKTQNPAKIERVTKRPILLTISSFATEAATASTTPSLVTKSPDPPVRPTYYIGTVEEVQLPPSVTVKSPVIKTDLTPQVMSTLLKNMDKKDNGQGSSGTGSVTLYSPAGKEGHNGGGGDAIFYANEEMHMREHEDIVPIGRIGVQAPDGPEQNIRDVSNQMPETNLIGGSGSEQKSASLRPHSYDVLEPGPDNQLISQLKLQLKDSSALTHALENGQWIYESQSATNEVPRPQPFQSYSSIPKETQLLDWIKNLEQDIQPTRKRPSNLDDTTPMPFSTWTSTEGTTAASTISTTTTTTTATTTTTTTTKPEVINDNRIATLPVRRVQTTTTTTTTTTTASTTTTQATQKTLGEIVASALAQSAAPLAGLSAATLAYGAAAMLPVWLPFALGKKKRRRRRSSGFSRPPGWPRNWAHKPDKILERLLQANNQNNINF